MAVLPDSEHGQALEGPSHSTADQKDEAWGQAGVSSRGPEDLYIEGFVNDCPTRLLIDTGAAVTVVSDGLYTRTGLARSEITAPCEHDSLQGAGGTSLQVIGTAMMSLTIGPARCYHRVRVVDNLFCPCIVGRDLLKHIPCKISSGDGRITFQVSPATVSSAGQSLGEVRLQEEVRIPPQHEVTVETRVKGSKWPRTDVHGDCAWVEARPGIWESHECLVANGVVNAINDWVPVGLLNPTDTEAVLPAGTCIADLREIVEMCPISSCHTQDKDTSMIDDNGWVDHAKDDTLWDVLSLDRSSLTEDQVQQVQEMVNLYRHVFAMNSEELGQTHVMQHRIDTKGAGPIFQRARRLPFSKQSEAREIVDKMIWQGIVEESSSPWSSPIVLVTKKDGSTRFCVDYRRLNAETRKDSYPLPRIDDTLDALGGAQFFSTLDLCSGYHQLPMAAEDKEKTAFSTPDGHYQFTVLPFGVCNGPSAFQCLMAVVLAGLQWHNCLIYIDDIIVFGRSFDEHMSRLEEVFVRLAESHLRLKPSKCYLFCQEVEFLGHVVSRKGIATDPAKIEKLSDWPRPDTAIAVRSFLGFSGYYRRFVKDYATLVAPLHSLIHKNTPFRWTEDCEQAFRLVKGLTHLGTNSGVP